MLLKDIKTIFQNELDHLYPKEEVDSFFFRFMEHYLNLERFTLVLQPNLVISKEEGQPFFEGLARLRKEEPLQYILGEVYFMDVRLRVNPDVLIPRPETEELVQWAISEAENDGMNTSILDVGTGSGCISIALAKHLPNAKVYGLDISENALKVANENAKTNQVAVNFIHGDILNLEYEEKFDVIVSNPPYVRELERVHMQNNVRNHEPELALFVPDENPLKFYKAIVNFSKRHLNAGGKLFLEINQYLSKASQQLLVDNHLVEVELRKDIFGNFRMLKGKVPNKRASA